MREYVRPKATIVGYQVASAAAAVSGIIYQNRYCVIPGNGLRSSIDAGIVCADQPVDSTTAIIRSQRGIAVNRRIFRDDLTRSPGRLP